MGSGQTYVAPDDLLLRSGVVMYAKERLYLTSNRKGVVKEGHKDAANLLCAVNKVIPKEFESKVPTGCDLKERPRPANKEKTGGGDKGGLTVIKKTGRKDSKKK